MRHKKRFNAEHLLMTQQNLLQIITHTFLLRFRPYAVNLNAHSYVSSVFDENWKYIFTLSIYVFHGLNLIKKTNWLQIK